MILKKIIAVLIVIYILFPSAALSDDLLSMGDEELLELYRNVLNEMERRGLPHEQEAVAAINDRVLLFFSYWNSFNVDGMLTLCDSDWKAATEDPRMELFRILQNRTPRSMEIEAAKHIAGESLDGLTYYLVEVVSYMDKNNGTSPERCRFSFLVREENDGCWYICPRGLETWETVGEDFASEENMILYYQPSGGEYYHLDQNCKRVNPKYLPLKGMFMDFELNDEPYRNLKPCEICGAPERSQ